MKRLLESLKVDKIASIEVEGIDTIDYPDFCDAYIASAEVLQDGEWRIATDEELDIMSDDRDLVYQEVQDFLF